MTDTKHPEALRLAALYDADAWPGGLSLNAWAAASAAELRRLHAENTTLQQGYDAARMEIESLRDEVKEYRHGAGVQKAMIETLLADKPAGEYPPLPEHAALSPMAKVAAALRQKAEQEDAAYQARRSDQGLMESEWGPMEDAPPHEDPPMHVAVVEGDDAVRTLQWNRDVAAFTYPVGTLLYAARSQAFELP